VTTNIALLRAVNVAGRNMVGMADLKEMSGALGLGNPRTLLQSGNLLFDSNKKPAVLEKLLTGAAKTRLGVETTFFVRTCTEWQEIIAANPYPDQARADPGHLVLMVLGAAPDQKQVAALRAAIRGRETVEAHGRQAYVVYPDGIGRSKLTVPLIEKHLGTPATGRNWNTVLKLAALATP
jgi:uncharacterized protein (DUF1697 family)